jgi:RNA polymerase sigma factor (sigma-70 family)
MVDAQLNAVVRHLQRLARPPDGEEPSDGGLLERFVTCRDEAAFAALVRRHGPLVLGVCRRVLGDGPDAEDAFQATFLVLFRRAHALRRGGTLAGWLYTVAYHAALKARAGAARRRRYEREALDMPRTESCFEDVWHDLQPVLDEELNRLPDKYRAPIILCYLEGKTYTVAARLLNCPAGTVKSRLARARDLLRARLARRGVTLPAGLTGAVLAGRASAAVPAALVQATLGTTFGTAAGASTAPAAALAEGVLKAMFVTNLRTVLATLGAAALVIAGALAWADPAPTPPQAPAAPPARAEAPVNRPQDEAKTMTVTGSVLDAQGKPVAGATVAVVGRPRRQYRSGDPGADRIEVLAHGKTGADGRFRLTPPRTSSARFREVHAVAAAPGHALAWRRLGADAESPEAVLRLPPEQVVRGRLVDLQGLPAAGVRVAVSWIGATVNREADGLRLGELPRELGLWPEPTVTDEQGRFVIRGCNRDRGFTVNASADRFTPKSFQVRPVGERRPESVTYGIDPGGFLFTDKVGPDEKGQPEVLSLTLAPAQTLEGQVLYEDTGKPVPGTRVLGTTTDRDGRFRLQLSRTVGVTLTVIAPEGEPYLSVYHRVEWPKGAVRHTVEIRLPRGALVRGRVTEAGSGAPVAGACVQFYPQRLNDTGLSRHVLTGYQACDLTKADGTFTIAVLPLPGHVLIQGPTLDYVHQEIGSEMLYYNRPGGSRYYPDGIVRLAGLRTGSVKEVAVTLRRGVTVRGRILGPDGKPVARVVLLHRLYVSTDLGWHFATEARDGWFEIHGIDPEKPVPVYFLDAEHQTGARVEMSGKQAGQEITVRLAPCGRATARYVDGDGKPLAGYHIAPDIVITPGRPAFAYSAEDEATRAQPIADAESLTNLDRHNYWDKVKTAADGRITFPALIPGATYRIGRWDKDQWLPHKEFTAKPGETVDLGEVVIRKAE